MFHLMWDFLFEVLYYKKIHKELTFAAKEYWRNIMFGPWTKWFPFLCKADSPRCMTRLLIDNHQFFFPKMTDCCPYILLQTNYTQNKVRLAFAWQEVNIWSLNDICSHPHLYFNPIFPVFSTLLICKLRFMLDAWSPCPPTSIIS